MVYHLLENIQPSAVFFSMPNIFEYVMDHKCNIYFIILTIFCCIWICFRLETQWFLKVIEKSLLNWICKILTCIFNLLNIQNNNNKNVCADVYIYPWHSNKYSCWRTSDLLCFNAFPFPILDLTLVEIVLSIILQT